MIPAWSRGIWVDFEALEAGKLVMRRGQRPGRMRFFNGKLGNSRIATMALQENSGEAWYRGNYQTICGSGEITLAEVRQTEERLPVYQTGVYLETEKGWTLVRLKGVIPLNEWAMQIWPEWRDGGVKAIVASKEGYQKMMEPDGEGQWGYFDYDLGVDARLKLAESESWLGLTLVNGEEQIGQLGGLRRIGPIQTALELVEGLKPELQNVSEEMLRSLVLAASLAWEGGGICAGGVESFEVGLRGLLA